jgi:hypothetical protein
VHLGEAGSLEIWELKKGLNRIQCREGADVKSGDPEERAGNEEQTIKKKNISRVCLDGDVDEGLGLSSWILVTHHETMTRTRRRHGELRTRATQ